MMKLLISFNPVLNLLTEWFQSSKFSYENSFIETSVSLVGPDDVDALVASLAGASAAWRGRGAVERAAVLQRVGDVLAARRGELIEVAAAETGKTIDQADPEVSEAVDFCRHYAELSLQLEDPTFMCSSRFEPLQAA